MSLPHWVVRTVRFSSTGKLRSPIRLALSSVAMLVFVASGLQVGVAPAKAAAANIITQGDLAVSIGSEVDEYTPTGTLVQQLVTSSNGLGLATGMAFDGSGNLYVTDFANNQILKRDAISGTVSVFATSASLGGGHVFNSPESIVFDKGYQHMYVSDANRGGPGGGINVIDMATGKDSAFYSLPSSNGSEGVGESDWLAFDAASNLYMTNENPAQGVMRVNTTTGDIVQPSVVANLPTYGYALSFDHDGNLWVGDTSSILEYMPSGALVRQITNPNFSLIFAAVFNAAGDQFYAGDLDTGRVYRYDLSGNLLGSFGTGGGVEGLAVAGAAVPPNSGGPTDIALPYTAGSNEPSVAVDPHNPNHVVIGYNHMTQNKQYQCAWSETTNGGATWQQGLLPGMAQNNNGSDPTVRFASDGTLYYSCEVLGPWVFKASTRAQDVDILLYKSGSGQAYQFSANAAVVDHVRHTCQVQSSTRQCDSIFDHPSLVMAHQPGSPSGTATRAELCWAVSEGQSSSKIFTTWVDPTGVVGVKQKVGDGEFCFMSGTATLPAVSWFDPSGPQVVAKTSIDGGLTWTSLVTVPTQGLLPYNDVDSGIWASPVALVVSDGGSGLRLIVSYRGPHQALIKVADSTSSFAQLTILPGNGDGAFLPGVGNCPNVIGAYDRSASTGDYGYTVWARSPTGTYSRVFATSQDMGAGYDIRYGYQRIGDYTDAGCVGTTAWVAWTDSHNSQLTIHAIRLTIP